MEIIEQKFKDFVWDKFALFQSILSEKLYTTLLQFRTKQDKINFENTLEAIIEIDDGLLAKIEDKYKPIDDMDIKEIATLLQEKNYKTLLDRNRYIDRALDLIDSYKRNDLTIASLYNSLANLYQSKSEYKKAEPLYLKSLKIYEDILGINHPDTATSYNNLALLYNLKGKDEKAELLYLKALKIREKVLGDKDYQTAQSYNNLALLYQSRDEYKKAESLYIKSLEIKEKVLGKNHLDTAKAYNNLASLYSSKGEYKKSEPLYLKALKISEDTLVENHPYRIIFSKNLYHLPTYINAIKIKDYFSIKDMEIDDLNANKEIYFVGENGDGKTILLQAIALALKGDEYEILAEDYIKNIKKNMKLSTKDSIFPDKYKEYKNIKNLFAYGINRNKISSNEEDTEITSYSGLFDTPSIYKTTLLRDAEKFLEQDTILVNKFKEQMSFLMDEKFKITKTDKGLKYGDIEQFSMLSEGYKTTLIWLSDLLSRMIENQPEIIKLEDFKAIVLIDEVDLYLHPKWKYDFMYKLRQIFPKIQFIMTTHSLVTVLGASEDAVFYKVYKEDGDTKITSQIDDISYYTANMLLTSPIFSLDDMKARGFKKEDRLNDKDNIYREIHSEVRNYMKSNPNVLDADIQQKVREKLKEKLAKLRKK